MLAFGSVWFLGYAQPAYAEKTGLIVPLYSYPGTDWNTLVKEKSSHPSVPIVAIINPDSGPGVKDTNYVYGVQKLQSAGIRVIGYIYTANVGYDNITRDIDEYKNWYNVNGIFFDQMSNVKGNETFYAHLSNYSRSVGLNFTVGNPGVDTLPSYIGTVNNMVLYDKPNLPPVLSYEGWHKNFTKSNFSLVSYGVGGIDKVYVQNMSKLVQYMYITNGTLPNPFKSIPGYLDDLVNVLDGISDSVSVTVNASTIAGKPLTGFWTVVTFGKNTSSGFTPYTFSAVPGNNYTITMSNFKNYTLDHWSDGTKGNTIKITPTQNLALVAYYGSSGMIHAKNKTNTVLQNNVLPVHKTNSTVTNNVLPTHKTNSTLPQIPKAVPQSLNCNCATTPRLSDNGSISTTISYAAGDRAATYGISVKIYQDSSQSVYRTLDTIASNPFTIDSLPLGHTYKIHVLANGMGADTEYVRLDKTTKAPTTKELTLHLYPPGGMRPNVFYNDGLTPVANAIVYVKDQNNNTWGVDYTDVHGQTLRFWLEPTMINDDHYIMDVKIGQHLSYTYWPVFLYAGSAREINIVTPWPPMIDSLITVKAYDKQSQLLSAKNSSFAVDLLDNNGNFISESKIDYHGNANFANLKVGDYTFRLVDPSNGAKWGESKVTIDGTKTSFSIIKTSAPLGVSANQTQTTS